jgi:tetratricopeptide (TPR) repeat protein
MLLIATGIFLITLLVRVGWTTQQSAQPAPRPAAIEAGSQQAVNQVQAQLQRNPEDPQTYAELGLNLLQQVRESGDVSLYGRAGDAFAAALQRDPHALDALIGQGVLALALHEFTDALNWADRAWAINPFRAQILGIKVDALVELGRYPEAVETLQQMVDLRPDLHSYTRVSYLRELHGEVDGAKEAMRMAVEMGVPATEEWAWTLVQLAHLYWNSGDVAEAESLYRQVLVARPDYPYAVAGLARVLAVTGDMAAAITAYAGLTQRLPLPEFVVALGELYLAANQPEQAGQQFDLVRVMQKLNATGGMNVDLELATFEVNYGSDPAAALAQAQVAYTERPTIYAADTLAWAYFKTGNLAEAQRYSQEALRLGTQDALLYFHAGMIAAAAGDTTQAESALSQALAINPHFSVVHAPEAVAKLAEIKQ